MSNFELIDDFLANRLSEQEMKAFEQQLAGDPSLKDEVDFQRQVVEGVRQARAMELKVMLKNVPVSSAGWSGGKLAAAVVSASIVATSLYLYLKEEPAVVSPIDSTTEEVVTQPETPADTPATGAIDESGNETEKSDKAASGQAKQKLSKTPAPVKKPDLQVTDPSGELEETETDDANAMTRSEISTSKMEVLTEPAHKTHTFHYQFADGKLTLFGPFDKNLYEILEIHGSGHALFLFYKENYYLLDENETKVKPLQPIRDGQLLKKLKEYRGQ